MTENNSIGVINQHQLHKDCRRLRDELRHVNMVVTALDNFLAHLEHHKMPCFSRSPEAMNDPDNTPRRQPRYEYLLDKSEPYKALAAMLSQCENDSLNDIVGDLAAYAIYQLDQDDKTEQPHGCGIKECPGECAMFSMFPGCEEMAEGLELPPPVVLNVNVTPPADSAPVHIHLHVEDMLGGDGLIEYGCEDDCDE